MSEKLRIPSEFPRDFVRTPEAGLSVAQAAKIRGEGFGNSSKAERGDSVGRILFKNFFTFFNMLNIALAVCLLLVGSYKNMLFMGVVLSNTLISTVQELRAKRTINKLRIASLDKVQVMRDGKYIFLPPDELVKGDIVRLSRGSQVPADAIVLSGEAALNEALLTGESEPVTKRPNDWALSGSFVSGGALVCQLVMVGDESYVNRLTRDARKTRAVKSQLMEDLNRLLRYLTVVLVPLGLLLFAKEYLIGKTELGRAVTGAVAAMIGMIPEGLMLLTGIALAVGVVRLGRKGALVQELYGIETLARADVLCLDKTGTLTTGDMSLSEIIPFDGDEESAKRLISRFLGAFTDEKSPTLEAIREVIPPDDEAPVHTLAFSSERKTSAAEFGGGRVLILGAPSFVMEGAYAGEVKQTCEKAAASGKRVLLLAEAEGEIGAGGLLPPEKRPLCAILLEDTLRPNAEDTLRWFKTQGVDIKVISGDDPITVSSIARRLKLGGAEKYIDVSKIDSDEELASLADKYVVFGRVSPERKRVLVRALKAEGRHVAMTGDGVNDIPALRAADCSICMAGGTDAAKHASQLTLVASDFTALPAVVAEGRRAVNNVTRAAGLFLVKTLYSFFISLVMLVLPRAHYPFEPIQLTLISAFTVGVPSFFLSLEGNKEPIRGSFIHNIVSAAMPSAIAVTLSALIITLTRSDAYASTLATITTAQIGILTLVKLCLPMNLKRALLTGAMAACLYVGMRFFPGVFSLVKPDLKMMLLPLALTAASALVIFAAAPVFRTVKGRYKGEGR